MIPEKQETHVDGPISLVKEYSDGKYNGIFLVDKYGRGLCKIWLNNLFGNKNEKQRLISEMEANSERIVATWNACQEIPTKLLKEGAVRDLMEALMGLASWKMRDGSPCFCPAGRHEDETPHSQLYVKEMPTFHSTACEDARAAILKTEAK